MEQPPNTNGDQPVSDTEETSQTTTQQQPTPQPSLASAMASELAGVSAIRDIVFGDQIRQYEERFNKLYNELKALQQSLEKKLEQLNADMSDKLNVEINNIEVKHEHNLHQSVTEVNTNFETELDELRQQLNNQISSVEVKSEQNLIEKTEEVNTDLQDQIDEIRQVIQENMANLQDKWGTELNELINKKLDRAEFSEALVTFGTNLRAFARQWNPTQESSADLSDQNNPLKTEGNT